jgi:hypothetical protein
VLLVLAVALVVRNAVARQKRGKQQAEARGWNREDKMLEELDKLAAPFRAVPAEVWARYGGPPDFLGSFGHTTT